MTSFRSHLLLSVYFVTAIAFVLWSYALTDPNLVLTSFSPYWKLQQWLWTTIWQQPLVLSGIYLTIILTWFTSYTSLIVHFSGTHQPLPSIYKKVVIAVAVLLVLAYNALSHDIFNYIFNAKMVVQYQLDPHIHTAIEFPQDLWTRFMHNTHTPAPYGYGWTGLSLVPFFFTQKSFTLSWLTFKSLNLVALFFLWRILALLNQKVSHYNSAEFDRRLFILFANPLLLIETLSTGHNDLWMMVPALFAVLAVVLYWQTKRVIYPVLAVLAFAFSLSTKWATLAILPIMLLLIGEPWIKAQTAKLPMVQVIYHWFEQNWITLASIAMFLPLLTDRSQQFHPWYLLWALVWLPLMKKHLWFDTVLIFSFSSMLRYLPWLLAGGYSTQVLLEQKLITWGIPALWLIMRLAYAKISAPK